MRAAVYCRVSSQDQIEGYSLEAQRRMIRQWCEVKGHTIVAELADEGKSAKSDTLAKRPAFLDAISMVKRGDADVIVAHKPDRLARNLRVLLNVLHELEGRVVAIEGDFDYTTPEGKLKAHILGSVAQWFSDNLSQEVKKGKAERRRQGLYNARLPFGAKRNPDDDSGKLPPVPDTDPVLCTIADRRTWSRYDALQHIFEQAAAGLSCPQLVHELASLGFHLGLGTVWEILTNRFYLGEVSLSDPTRGRSGRRAGWLPGAHDPFIDVSLFDRAAAVRSEHQSGVSAIRRSAHVYPLSGLGRCGVCGGPMHCRTNTKSGNAHVFCANRHDRHDCTQKSVVMAALEEQCVAYVRSFSPPADWETWLLEQVPRQGQDTRREQAAIERRLRKLKDLYVWGDLPAEEYAASKRELERQRALCEPATVSRAVLRRLLHYWRNLAEAYQDATPEERNVLLHELFTTLVVQDDRLVKVGYQPAFERILRAARPEASGTSGLAETVWIAESSDDGLWIVPPLPFVQHAIPRIPVEAWPQVAAEYAAGTSVPALAAAWKVSDTTIWRTLRRVRSGHQPQDSTTSTGMEA